MGLLEEKGLRQQTSYDSNAKRKQRCDEKNGIVGGNLADIKFGCFQYHRVQVGSPYIWKQKKIVNFF